MHGISGLVVEYIVAIDVTRVRFPADALELMWDLAATAEDRAVRVRTEYPSQLDYSGVPRVQFGTAPPCVYRNMIQGGCSLLCVCSGGMSSLTRAVPGIEPGTSCTLSENHATRPNSQ